MDSCSVILELGAGIEPETHPKPKHTILEAFTVYNYFCLKMGCFQSFFGRDKSVIKCCPNCGLNDRTVGIFE